MTHTDAATPDPGVDPSGLVDALVQSAFVTVAVLSRIGIEHDLSLTQLRALGILRDRRLKMSQLAEYLGLDRSTLSGLVERAEKRHLMQRSPNPDDGRAVDVALTPTGTGFAERVHAQVVRALGPQTAMLADRDRVRLTVLLRQLLDG